MSVVLAELAERETLFLRDIRNISEQLYVESSAIAHHIPSGDESKVVALIVHLYKAMIVLREYSSMELAQLKEPVSFKRLKALMAVIDDLGKKLLVLSKKGPFDAAKLLEHSPIIAEIDDLTKRIDQELQNLKAGTDAKETIATRLAA